MAEAVKGQKASVVAKAGLWYTICNFIFRGMAFITTPIFTRLMAKGELGSFSNFSSWVSILLVVTSFDMAQSIIRSKLDVEDDIDCYISSILSLSVLTTSCFYVIVRIFPEFFMDLFQTEMKYINLMFLYLLVSPAYSMLITKHRAFYKYKTFVLLTGISLVSATLTSLVLVIMMNDKLAGRMLGNYVPHILMNAIIFIYLFAKGKKIKLKYWKYALVICLPLVPHNLSLYLLSSSDKVIITKLCGVDLNAIYAVAYSCYHIVTVLFDSMNKAWAPWLLESLHHGKEDEIKKTSKMYIIVFEIIILGILMLVPELIYILGGKKYADAIYCLPPLVLSCLLQFIYTMYVNIEFYKKKTIGVAAATMISAIINIALNLLFIPMFKDYGYIVAAYTTLVGYLVLFVLHYLIVKKMGLAHIYDIKFNILIISATFAVSALMNVLYSFTMLRYAVVAIYSAFVIWFAYKNLDMIKGIFKKKKKKA